MKIAVVGTGALGALFAGYLARAGEEVWAVDIKPEIVETIRAAGVRIREASGEENSIPLRAEVDFVNGAVVCEGAGLGMETPINWMLMSLVKALEKTYSLHLG